MTGRARNWGTGPLRQLCLALLSWWTGSSAAAQSTAFYYGATLPEELLQSYQRVVVEPGHGFEPARRGVASAELVAYLSMGEVAEASPEHKLLAASWVLARNDAWHSAIVDLASPGYRAHFLTARFEPLWARGYRTFFLDTLDSYLRVQGAADAQRKGLVALIKEMHARHPELQLLFNRGFELLPELAPIAHGVVAESLFDRFDAASGRYVPVPAQDRDWLRTKLDEVKQRYRLPVTVIDYRPVAQREQARETARRIAAAGFAPYVSDGALGSVGTGPFQIVPRKVLVLTNQGAPADSDARRLLGPLLESLGFVPVYGDVAQRVPSPVPGTVHALVSWLQGEQLAPDYEAFVARQRADGVRYVAFGAPRLEPDSTIGRELGLRARANMARGKLEARPKQSPDKVEAQAVGMAVDLLPLEIAAEGTSPLLTLADERGALFPTVITTPWGGVAFSHFLAVRGLHGERAWTIDPLDFLSQALLAEQHPALDLSTLHGGRVAMITVRAAGLAQPSRHVGRPSNARLLRGLLSRHPLPHSLDAEPSPENQLSPADAEEARQLSTHPLVERASPRATSARLTRDQMSLTRLTPLLGADGRAISPLGGDYHYLPEGIGDAFPFARLSETLSATETPRRLCPASLDYHAASLASPGGHAAIEGLYQQLADQHMHVLSTSALRARIDAFTSQLLVRHLDDSFELMGAGPPSTLRIPRVLGQVQLARSSPLVLHARPELSYVSFPEQGSRRVYLGPAAERAPHLQHISGSLLQLAITSAGADRAAFTLHLGGAKPTRVSLAGLTQGMRVALRHGGRRQQGQADGLGEAHFQVEGSTREPVSLSVEPTSARVGRSMEQP